MKMQPGAPPTEAPKTCGYCGKSAQGNYSIHRNGVGDGPEVDLCDACGSGPDPTCEEIWAKLAQAPVSRPKPTVNAEERASLRDAFELWEEQRASVGETKSRKLILMLVEEALVSRLQPLCPDPSTGLVGIMGFALGAMASILRIPLESICIEINDPDESIQKKLLDFRRLNNGKDAEPAELAALAAELEPYVLVVPGRLFKLACERNTMAWAFQQGPLRDMAEKLGDNG